jgi:hypothetical protein
MVGLTGVGTGVTLSPRHLDFGNEVVGETSPPQIVTVKNTSNDPLHVNSIVGTGDYAETNDCGTIIPAGGSCMVSVTFTPTQDGVRTGATTFTDSDAGTSPQTVSLIGTGTETGVNPFRLRGAVLSGDTGDHFGIY